MGYSRNIGNVDLNVNGIIRKLYDKGFITPGFGDRTEFEDHIEKIFRTPYEIPNISDFIRNASYRIGDKISEHRDIYIKGMTKKISTGRLRKLPIEDSGIMIDRHEERKKTEVKFYVNLKTFDTEFLEKEKKTFDILEKNKNELFLDYIDEKEYFKMGIWNSKGSNWLLFRYTPGIKIHEIYLDDILDLFFY